LWIGFESISRVMATRCLHRLGFARALSFTSWPKLSTHKFNFKLYITLKLQYLTHTLPFQRKLCTPLKN
jgi:hypothetical protein